MKEAGEMIGTILEREAGLRVALLLSPWRDSESGFRATEPRDERTRPAVTAAAFVIADRWWIRAAERDH
jgi:hypothetical protein